MFIGAKHLFIVAGYGIEGLAPLLMLIIVNSQSEEMFDCLPAVRAAFHFTKVFYNNGVDEEEEAEKRAKEEKEKQEENTGTKEEGDEDVIKVPTRKVEKTLEMDEFRLFLQTLRQYYLYCQVGDDLLPGQCVYKHTKYA